MKTEVTLKKGEWPTVRLDDACSLITDGTHQTPTYADEGFVFLSSKNVVSGKIDWENVKRIPEWLHTELHRRLSPRKGDLLLAKNGTAPRIPGGIVSVAFRSAKVASDCLCSELLRKRYFRGAKGDTVNSYVDRKTGYFF